MDILENADAWAKTFRGGWLAHLQKTGSPSWEIYERPRNQNPITGKGVDLKSSQLVLISSAGGYLVDSQEPFDAGNPLGDYTVRTFPVSTPFEKLAYAHEHYDHAAINADPQVLMPLKHLREMVSEGSIGELAPVISIMGYQPDVSRLLDETIPANLKIVREENARVALLVPA